MKAISNIYLAWRKGKGSRRIIVGVIKNNVTEGTRFNYIAEGVEEAKKFGFTCYEGFPDTTKEYSENVINIFGQRIMRSERNDIDDFYTFWQIDKKYKDDNFYMLAYTQGLLPTDSFEFLADFNPKKGLSFISEIAGLSKLELQPNSLKCGDELTYQLEPTNDQDNDAVKLFKEGEFIGYVKKIHCRVFKRAKGTINVIVHRVEQNGKINRVFIRISI
ncbi:hypothetical protein [Saccharicrinis sp. 156]|uniref:hypothetical protein n=1 Tax=Saccharicrinis sp. 156 TaxID=3417574 RepID=UPI003D3279A9